MFIGDDIPFLQQMHQLKEIAKIGEGSFGKVYKAIDLTDKSICAVKVISKTIFKENHSSPESDIYHQLHHPNIVKCKRISENRKYYYIVMEYMEGGTLAELMRQRTLGDEEAAEIMKQILEGVNYLHERQIIHRDLKPENIMLSGGSVKIADFGLSFRFSSSEGTFHRLLNKKCGTIIYMAPEQFTEKYVQQSIISKYSKQVDSWSCGIFLFMLLTGGAHPYYRKDETKFEYVSKIVNQKSQVPSFISPLAKDLFEKLSTVTPIDRYNIGQALLHPWISRKFEDKIPLTYHQQIDQFLKEQQIRQQFKMILFLQYIQLNSPKNQIYQDHVAEEIGSTNQTDLQNKSSSPNLNKFKILQMTNRYRNQCQTTPRIMAKGRELDFSLTQKSASKQSIENILVFEKDREDNLNNQSDRSLKKNMKLSLTTNKFMPLNFQESFCTHNKLKLKTSRKLLPPLRTK